MPSSNIRVGTDSPRSLQSENESPSSSTLMENACKASLMMNLVSAVRNFPDVKTITALPSSAFSSTFGSFASALDASFVPGPGSAPGSADNPGASAALGASEAGASAASPPSVLAFFSGGSAGSASAASFPASGAPSAAAAALGSSPGGVLSAAFSCVASLWQPSWAFSSPPASLLVAPSSWAAPFSAFGSGLASAASGSGSSPSGFTTSASSGPRCKTKTSVSCSLTTKSPSSLKKHRVFSSAFCSGGILREPLPQLPLPPPPRSSKRSRRPCGSRRSRLLSRSW
mmetsp:Transcript_93028/g.252346  ORF Transcript_93028/g.252346 Transcript_93028/m.252346 type:complete len:286 (+) Transcript_93028:207-1064(+)